MTVVPFDTVRRALQRARAALELNAWEACIRHAEEALRLDPTSAAAFYLRAFGLGRLGEHAKALSAALEAARLDPSDVDHHSLIACEACNVGDYQRSEAAAREALRILPNSGEARRFLCIVYRTTDRLAEAESIISEAIELYPSYAFYHVELARVLLAAGQTPRAWASAMRAVELDPGLAQAHYVLGLASQTYSDREVDEALRTAARIDPVGYGPEIEARRESEAGKLKRGHLYAIALVFVPVIVFFVLGLVLGGNSARVPARDVDRARYDALSWRSSVVTDPIPVFMHPERFGPEASLGLGLESLSADLVSPPIKMPAGLELERIERGKAPGEALYVLRSSPLFDEESLQSIEAAFRELEKKRSAKQPRKDKARKPKPAEPAKGDRP